MKNFDLRISLLISLILLFFQSCGYERSSPLEEIDQPSPPLVYKNVINYQTNYLHSLQLPSGAIRDNETTNSRICPYFGNFVCLALLKDPTSQNIGMVKNYMLWYMNKLNGFANPVSGTTEISGSIYDYFGDAETTNGTYDSVDSYAATFLILAREYANCSKENKEWLLQYVDKLTLIARAMVKCI